MKDIAVVIPVHNEEDNIEALHTELMGVMNGLGLSYNVIYVNDGSKDASGSMLAHLAEADPNVTMIDFRRNFGQTAAIAAGIDHAHADVVVLMDADLQNDPADIPCLLEEMKNGNYDVVSGWRHNRKDPFITRKVPSMVANWLISAVTGVRLHDYGCTLKAYRREVLDEVRLYGEMHRFIPVYAAAIGANISEIVVNHRPRIHGRSKYGLMRTGKVFLDLITVKFLLNYSTRPMYLFGGFGLAVIAASFIPSGVALFRKFVLGESLNRSLLPLLGATLLILGMQSILLGLVAELLVRTYHEAQHKSIYVVRRIVE